MVKKIGNFECTIESTVIMFCFLHLSYMLMFYLIDLRFLIAIEFLRFLLALVLGSFVIKHKYLNVFVFYAHLNILIFCCYYGYILGYGYGFHMIIIFLISLTYLQNYNTFLVPIGISLFETAVFLIMQYFTKGLDNYPNPYMHHVNIINFLFVVIAVLSYIWINNKEGSDTLEKLETKEKILKYKMENDYLTGILNRRAINKIIDEKLKDLSSNKISSITLAILDIDNFKQINDTYGHDFGDLVIKNIAKIFKTQEENTSGFYAARWGGEEFIILLENYSHNDSFSILDELRKNIHQQTIKDNINAIRSTISIGFCYSKNSITKDSLIKKADTALYTAKKEGKNKTKSFNWINYENFI